MLSFSEMVNRRNIEGIGKLFIGYAIDDFTKSEYSKSFSNIRRGLEILTCDCKSVEWEFDLKNLCLSYSSLITNFEEFNFCRAFFLSYNSDTASNFLALDSIDQFLKVYPSDYIALYIRGRILSKLGKYNEALNCYYNSLGKKYSSKALYRIGQLKEVKLNQYGVEDIYNAYMLNTTSSCCCKLLKECSSKRDIIPGNLVVEKENLLMKKFISNITSANFKSEFELLLGLNDQSMEYNALTSMVLLEKFVKELADFQSWFTKEGFENREEEEEFVEFVPDYDELYYEALMDGQPGSYSDYIGDNDERENDSYGL